MADDITVEYEGKDYQLAVEEQLSQSAPTPQEILHFSAEDQIKTIQNAIGTEQTGTWNTETNLAFTKWLRVQQAKHLGVENSDGWWGNNTQNALADKVDETTFNAVKGLYEREDGNLNNLTWHNKYHDAEWQEIEQEIKAEAEPEAPAAVTTEPEVKAEEPVAEPSSPIDANHITEIQALLRSMDYEITNLDGADNQETRDAYQKFITDHKLENITNDLNEEALQVVRAEAGQSALIDQKLQQTQAQAQAGEELSALDVMTMQYAMQVKGFMPDLDGEADSQFKYNLNRYADFLKFAPKDRSYRTENAAQKVIDLSNDIEDIENAQQEFIEKHNIHITLGSGNNLAKIDELLKQEEERFNSTYEPKDPNFEGPPADGPTTRSQANEMTTWLLQLKGMENDRLNLIRERNGILAEEQTFVNLHVNETDWRRMSSRELVDATIIDEKVQLTKGEYKALLSSARELSLDGTHATEIADFYIDKFADHLPEEDQQRLHDAIEKYESIPVIRDEIHDLQAAQREDALSRNKSYMLEHEIIGTDENGGIEILKEDAYNRIINPYVSSGAILRDHIREQKFEKMYPGEKTPAEISKEIGAPSYARYNGNAAIGAAAKMELEKIKAAKLEAESKTLAAENTKGGNAANAEASEQQAINALSEKPEEAELVVEEELQQAEAQAEAEEPAETAENEPDPKTIEINDEITGVAYTLKDSANTYGGTISLTDSTISTAILTNPDVEPPPLDADKLKNIMADMGYDDPNHQFDVANPEEMANLLRANFSYTADIKVTDIPEQVENGIVKAAYEVNGQTAPEADNSITAPDNAALEQQQRLEEEAREAAEEANNKTGFKNNSFLSM